MAKIHIVGAGPAGTIAALSALRSGHDVVISEDHLLPGIPENCSGLFSVDGLESLSRYVDYKKHVINPIYGANICIGGSFLSVRRHEPVAFVCDRASMDQQLAANAADEGAQINYGERVNGSFHSDNIIGSDGPLSYVARHFHFPKIVKYAATLQAIVDYRCADPHIVEVFVSNNQFPGFFAWVIPRDDCTAEFGIGVELPNRPEIAWGELLRIKNISQYVRPKGAIIPLKARDRSAAKAGRRNILLAGDAAGQVKATTGGGVIFGGNCAELAGRYAIDPLRYDMEWRLRYGTDLLIHQVVHDHIASLAEPELQLLGRRLKKMNLDVYLSENGHMDRPTKMLRPQLVAHFLKNMVAL